MRLCVKIRLFSSHFNPFGALDRDVSRAAVVRAAVKGWLAAKANVDPALVVEEVRAGIVKRGREAQPRPLVRKTAYPRSEANVDPSAAKGEVGDASHEVGYVIGQVSAANGAAGAATSDPGAAIGEVGAKLCPSSDE